MPSLEPDYWAQTGECSTPDARAEWLLERVKDAKAEGCTHGRATISRDKTLLIYEAWFKKPVDHLGNLCEGEPRFAIAALASFESQRQHCAE